jgi:hypothetical protein
MAVSRTGAPSSAVVSAGHVDFNPAVEQTAHSQQWPAQVAPRTTRISCDPRRFPKDLIYKLGYLGYSCPKQKWRPYMKRLVLTIALLACLPVLAQDRSTNIPAYSFTVYAMAGSYRISAFDDRLIVTSTSMQRIGEPASPSCLLKLAGSVEIGMNDVIIHADEADYHCSTVEVEPRGNVHVNFMPRQ